MATKKPPAPAKHSASTLRVTTEAGKSKERRLAEVCLSTRTQNAVTVQTFTKARLGEIDLTEAMAVLHEKAGKIHAGDLTDLEATLAAQTVSLDTLFNELARRAALNIGQHMQATESYMRLALKAQAQCARTIETLAAIKNPPVVFAKQANISHGHQQVNNGNSATSTHAPAHTGKTINQQNELLEHQHHGERMDTSKAVKTSGTDQAMAAVE